MITVEMIVFVLLSTRLDYIDMTQLVESVLENEYENELLEVQEE